MAVSYDSLIVKFGVFPPHSKINFLSCQSFTVHHLKIFFSFLSLRHSPALVLFFFLHILFPIKLTGFEGKDYVLYLFVFPTMPNKYMNYKMNPKSVLSVLKMPTPLSCHSLNHLLTKGSILVGRKKMQTIGR